MKPWMYTWQICAVVVLSCISSLVMFSTTGWYTVFAGLFGILIAPAIGFTIAVLLDERKELIERIAKRNEQRNS